MLALPLLTALLLAQPIAYTEPWVDTGESNGVHVWYRDIEAENGRQIKGQTVIPVAPAQVWAVLEDVAHYVEFMPYLKELRVLEETAAACLVYERVDPPVVDARDYTVRVEREANLETQTYRRSWTLANDKGPPPREGTVRVIVNAGGYVLEPHGPNETLITYTLLTNPGGSIPHWLAKRANSSSVPDLLNAIRHRSVDASWKR
jgi:hypothetical protein